MSKYDLTEFKKRMGITFLFVILPVALIAGGVFWHKKIKAQVKLDGLDERQREELANSMFDRSLEHFKVLDETKVDKYSGPIKLTTYEEKNDITQETNFIFSEKYEDGYEFVQGKNRVKITPVIEGDGAKLERKAVSRASFGWDRKNTEGQFLAYDSKNEKHLFALSRDKNVLKNWSYYKKYQEEIKENWEFSGAVLKINENGSIGVYRTPMDDKSGAEMAKLEDNMAQRIANTLKEELGEDYLFREENFLFEIPKIYFVTKGGELKDAEVEIKEEKILSIKVRAEKKEFPIIVDPTISLADDMDYIQINGDVAGDNFGYSVASAGDVNGDGKDDVIVGAPYDDDNGSESGSVFVFYGGINSGSATNEADIKLTGPYNVYGGSRLGSSVNSAGDFNGDGFGDFIVGAPHYTIGSTTEDIGAIYICFGGIVSSGSIHGLTGTLYYTGSTGEEYAYLGCSVASAGDYNGDGLDDVIAGAYERNADSGYIYIVYGGSSISGTIDSYANIIFYGDSGDDRFGWSVSGGGDYNGDGKGDVIVGAYGDDDGGSGSGSAFIFYGGVTSGSASTKAAVKLTGDAAGDYFGISVSSAGDVNGDGLDDVIVGATGDDDGGSASGTAFIFYGGVTSGSASTKAAVKLTGDAAGDYFGISVSSAGDVNGDGLDDVIVGATGDDDGGSASGTAFIFYGGVTSGVATTKASVKLTGDGADDAFGTSVASAGDVNGDGLADVIVGATGDDDGGAESGSAKIFTFHDFHQSAKLTGDGAGDSFGYSVASAGDVNGDGLDDVVVGASGDDDGGSASGSAFIFHSSVPSGVASANADVKLTGDGADDAFGTSVASAGDVNGDGLADVIVGATGDDDGGSASGTTFIFYGGVTSGVATTKASVKLTGDGADDAFGTSVASAGDVNGDGLADVIVGATGDDDGGSASGTAFIFYGGVTSGGASTKAAVELTGDGANDAFGTSVASAGDVNGDGLADVIVGATGDDDGGSASGTAFIFYGGVTSGSATAKADVKLTGDGADDYFGCSVSGAGDVNGDGKDDVIVGAYGDDNSGSSDGSAFIFYSGTTSGGATAKAAVKLTGDAGGDYFGYSVSGAGDVNGDGLADVAVGAYGDDDSGSDSGSVFVFHGGMTSGGATAKADVKLTGDGASDYFGRSVYGGGDFNGDGKDDVIVGADGDDDGGAESGSVFVFSYGKSLISKLDGDASGDNFGISVSGAGDYNGDGLDDVVVGADQDDDGYSDSGSAFIFYGGVFSGSATTKANVKLTGDGAYDHFGRSVAGGGDINGDGKADVIVGADGDDDGGADSGTVFIFYGGVTSGVATVKASVKITGDSAGDGFGVSVGDAGDFNLDGESDIVVGATGDDDGGSGSGTAFIFYGGVTSGGATTKASVKITGDASGDNFGISVAGAGDVNEDGKADVIVGADGDDDGGSGSGTAFIFYGGTTSGTATGKANVKLTGDNISDGFGASVASAGDVNRDHQADVIVGAKGDDDGGADSGSVFIFYGGVTSGVATTKASVKLTGDDAGDNFGSDVAGAGDINLDGKADVIVGALGDNDAGSGNGSAYIFYGGLSSGAASDKVDVKLFGDDDSDQFGVSVAGAGDVNGDGKDDVIVGANGDDDGGNGSGSVKIITDPTTDYNSDSPSFLLTGDAAADYFGFSVASAGDYNGDGKDDVIVGAYNGSSAKGAAYIFYGGELAGGATAKAEVIFSGDAANDSFGYSVAGVGDVNLDGKDDVAVGSYEDDDGGADSGTVFIFYGGVTSGVATTKASVKITGDAADDGLGFSVASAGDVNGDGKNDIIAGTPYDDDGGATSGTAFIFYGGVTSGAATTKASVKITGDASGDNFGISVAGAGDVNGDGLDDVIVGAYGDDDGGAESGSAFIFHGGVTSGGATAKADVKLTGDSAADAFGYSVSGAGDVNGDGLDDVIVGATVDDDGGSDSGSAFIFYGGVTSGVATTKSDVKITGDAADDYFGYSVSGAGDVNGDGKGDVIVGAYSDDDGGLASGSAFIFHGGVTSGGATTKADIKLTGSAASDNFGWSVAGAGDINRDGKDDIVIGTPGDDSSQGSVKVIYGHRVVPDMPNSLTPTSGTYGLGGSGDVPIVCSGGTYNGTSYADKYGQTDVFDIQAYYDSAWHDLASDDADGSYTWDVSSLGNKTGVVIRCRNDISGTTGSWSRWYDANSNLTLAVHLSAPTITNSTGESNVTASAARLNGELTDDGGATTTVYVYWGDEDGGTTAGSWDNEVNLGTKSEGTFYQDISSLDSGQTYYYRYYSTNSQGNDWADSSESFVTLGTPTVTNSMGESNVTASAARLNGELTDDGGATTNVYVYWGDNDGGTTAGNWDSSYDLGTQAEGSFYHDISSLNSNTTYFYRYYASNSQGGDWADSSETFDTWSGPTVTNAPGASDIRSTEAKLNGTLSDDGGATTTVYLYWGDEDGGTTAGSWDNEVNLGTKSEGSFYYDVSDLVKNETYYYRCYSINSVGNDWADSSESFLTLDGAQPIILKGGVILNGGTDLR